MLTHYGKQQGAKRGYNPHKPGRASHHPIIAFVPDIKLIANLYLRSGNTGSAEGSIPFLEETFTKLIGKNISHLRLDSGFYGNDVFDYLKGKEKPISYIVAARFYELIQCTIAVTTTWTTALLMPAIEPSFYGVSIIGETIKKRVETQIL